MHRRGKEPDREGNEQTGGSEDAAPALRSKEQVGSHHRGKVMGARARALKMCLRSSNAGRVGQRVAKRVKLGSWGRGRLVGPPSAESDPREVLDRWAARLRCRGGEEKEAHLR